MAANSASDEAPALLMAIVEAAINDSIASENGSTKLRVLSLEYASRTES
jgi:hypothetical protein